MVTRPERLKDLGIRRNFSWIRIKESKAGWTVRKDCSDQKVNPANEINTEPKELTRKRMVLSEKEIATRMKIALRTDFVLNFKVHSCLGDYPSVRLTASSGFSSHPGLLLSKNFCAI